MIALCIKIIKIITQGCVENTIYVKFCFKLHKNKQRVLNNTAASSTINLIKINYHENLTRGCRM